MTASADLGIAGIGLIGGSIAARAKRGGATVSAADPSGAALDEALRLGLIDRVCPGVENLLACRTLVIAAPVDASLAALRALAGRTQSPWPDLIVDVASVKAPFAGLAVRNFVPTHPFAGSQRSGPGAADPELFAGRAWAYVPVSGPARELAIGFITAMGARPVAVEAAAHDDIAGLVSHLPQLVSVALGTVVARRLAEPGVTELAGPGLESMLRLAGSNPAMWFPILEANRERTAAAVRETAQTLEAFATALEGGEIARLASYFADARRAAVRFDRHNEGNPR